MYKFPKGLYADIKIEESYFIWRNIRNGEVVADNDNTEIGARIRVYDGKMWYSCSTNKIDNIQAELDNLAKLTTPDDDILNDPIVSRFEANKDSLLLYDGKNDVRKIKREKFIELLQNYIDKCVDPSINEIKNWNADIYGFHHKHYFYSSKGAEIVWDKQAAGINMTFSISCHDAVYEAWKGYKVFSFEELLGHEDEIIGQRDRMLDYARNVVDIPQGEYLCVFSPNATALFTHESFGHKSESDFMLNDKTLQDEWVLGKKVGNEKISICDRGDVLNAGYVPYDDEGTKAKENFLIKDGILVGRLHNAKSASILNEPLTGNARAYNYLKMPIVRMTNTYMEPGTDEPEEMIKGIRDGIYVYDINRGSGNSEFFIIPNICYRIHDGRICEPVKVNLLTGNVFKTLFDVEAVGNDFTEFYTFWCGKGGQTISVGVGAPSIRIKSLKVN